MSEYSCYLASELKFLYLVGFLFYCESVPNFPFFFFFNALSIQFQAVQQPLLNITATLQIIFLVA